MHRLSFIPKGKALYRIILIAGLLTVGIMFVLRYLYDVHLPNGSVSIVSLQLAFSKDIFQNILKEWGAAGIAYYRSTLWIDFIYPIAYAVFLSGWLALLCQKLDSKPRRTHTAYVLMPVLSAAADWVENVLHLVLMRGPENMTQTQVIVVSAVSTVKWALILLSIVVILNYGIKTLFQSRQS